MASPAAFLKVVAAARHCTDCDLYKRATQTVFGEGAVPATIMLVGEQPGDREDVEGRPFVGPAGRLLDKALAAAEIDRGGVYVTNAVKHFKWEPRGKRRLHSKPNAVEIHACNHWLADEIRLVRPQLIVCLGATAAQAFLGRAFRLTQQRGAVLPANEASGGARLMATYHPSALLRMMRDEAEYARAWDALVGDLVTARRSCAAPTSRTAYSAARPRPRSAPRTTRSRTGARATRTRPPSSAR